MGLCCSGLPAKGQGDLSWEQCRRGEVPRSRRAPARPLRLVPTSSALRPRSGCFKREDPPRRGLLASFSSLRAWRRLAGARRAPAGVPRRLRRPRGLGASSRPSAGSSCSGLSCPVSRSWRTSVRASGEGRADLSRRICPRALLGGTEAPRSGALGLVLRRSSRGALLTASIRSGPGLWVSPPDTLVILSLCVLHPAPPPPSPPPPGAAGIWTRGHTSRVSPTPAPPGLCSASARAEQQRPR